MVFFFFALCIFGQEKLLCLLQHTCYVYGTVASNIVTDQSVTFMAICVMRWHCKNLSQQTFVWYNSQRYMSLNLVPCAIQQLFLRSKPVCMFFVCNVCVICIMRLIFVSLPALLVFVLSCNVFLTIFTSAMNFVLSLKIIQFDRSKKMSEEDRFSFLKH